MYQTIKDFAWEGKRKYVTLGALVSGVVLWITSGDLGMAVDFVASLVS